jgi:putative LysE/RhtB family amino acid efflux pump
LTLANPLTIASFAAVFAGLGALSTPSRTPTVFLVVGAFCGSALWWLILSCTVARMRHVLSPVALHAINRASGLMLMAFGV